MNHALREVGEGFEYFAVCDADGTFPSDFVERLLPNFSLGDSTTEGGTEPEIAFVQARQEGNPNQTEGFARSMSVAVGGFPEIVTEDLAFSMKLRGSRRGVYADEVVCDEDFPRTWRQLRKRSEKRIRGTAECFRGHLKAFLKSARVPWWEKLDALVHGMTHAMAVPLLPFLLVLATVLPWGVKEFRMPGAFFLPAVPDGKNLIEQALGLR